ncbi:MAG: hypothetical protein EOP06_21990 [Proteobacteria bacterium]|nr:MAG: hypothetical protein EOP06_21990 [Pseudomonadota bacterium]
MKSLFKNAYAVAVTFLIVGLMHANPALASWKDDPPEIKIGSNCGSDTKCIERMNKAVGFELGRYQECERLNTMTCYALAPGQNEKVRCDISKFTSVIIKEGCRKKVETENGCSYKTNTVIIDFSRQFPEFFGVVQVPFVESETGYKFACDQ